MSCSLLREIAEFAGNWCTGLGTRKEPLQSLPNDPSVMQRHRELNNNGVQASVSVCCHSFKISLVLRHSGQYMHGERFLTNSMLVL